MASLLDAETRIRAISGAVFVVLVMGCIWLSPWTNVALWFLVGGLGVMEFRKADPQSGGLPIYFILVAALSLAIWSWPGGGGAYDPWHALAFVWMVWANDTGAYLVGKPLGRHKLWPRVSPGKSWEGLAGGLVASAVVAGLIFGWPWAGLGALIGALATAGDLTQSAWKRKLGLKDSGSLIPGHGGVLDRFDGFLFAAPMYWQIMRNFVFE
jgi:CDP-diglyceride synthetase